MEQNPQMQIDALEQMGSKRKFIEKISGSNFRSSAHMVMGCSVSDYFCLRFWIKLAPVAG
jgi:hypothetical protein